MKIKNGLKSLTLLTIVFFVCAFAPKANAQIVDNVAGEAVYDVKELAKKAVLEGKVEIIDCKMEKTVNKDGESEIKITGTATHKPAKLKKKSLKDTPGFGLKAYLYDANGIKLTDGIPVGDYGKNDQPENVKFKEPFPFHGEYNPGGYFNQEIFDKATYCVVRGWNTAEKVSSKDSE